MSNKIFNFLIRIISPFLIDKRFEGELGVFVKAYEEKEKYRLRQEYRNKFIRLRTGNENYYD